MSIDKMGWVEMWGNELIGYYDGTRLASVNFTTKPITEDCGVQSASYCCSSQRSDKKQDE